MNLDDLAAFRKVDSQNMIDEINSLPDQIWKAWEMGMANPLPEMPGLKGIVLTGMGGSAIGADLLAAYAAPHCPVPLVIHRDYDLPAWVQGPQVLVIACSHSGETEETLAACQQALTRGCRVLIITTGGRLARLGQDQNIPVWVFQHAGQPRAAAGYVFGLLLAALHRLGFLSDPAAGLQKAVEAMRSQQAQLLPEVPAARNPAKRYAGQFVGRPAVIFGADFLAPVARRWKGQINELAKAWGQFEILPEADHNTLAALNYPESALSGMIALFLLSSENHPRNQLRLDFTRQIFMTQGINTDSIQASGDGVLAHIWTALHFGDYMSYYLAMAYAEDPTPVDVLVMLKQALSSAG